MFVRVSHTEIYLALPKAAPRMGNLFPTYFCNVCRPAAVRHGLVYH